MAKTAALVEGTSIPKDRMAAMMAHSKAMLGESNTDLPGDQLIQETAIDHRSVAQNLRNARPNLLDDISQRIRNRSRREGVQGTSPTPGQDNLGLGTMPPTTSMVTNPGTLGGEDPEEEIIGEDPGVEHPNEALHRDATDVLFSESDDEDDEDDDEGEDDDDKEDEDEEGKDTNESVEVHCEKCGYEEEYNLSEGEMQSNPPPMTAEGQLDTTCPMCGGDMDFSLIGATDQSKVSDPVPFTDPRGNEGDEPPVEAVHYARSLMHRLGEGEDVDDLVNEVIQSDFLPKNFRFTESDPSDAKMDQLLQSKGYKFIAQKMQTGDRNYFHQNGTHFRVGRKNEWEHVQTDSQGPREKVHGSGQGHSELASYLSKNESSEAFFGRAVREWYDNDLTDGEREEVLSEASAYSKAFDKSDNYDRGTMLGKAGGSLNARGDFDSRSQARAALSKKSYSDLHPIQQRAVKQSVRAKVDAGPRQTTNRSGQTVKGYGAYDKLHGRLANVGFTTSKDTYGAIKAGKGVDPAVNQGHIDHDNLVKHISKGNGWSVNYNAPLTQKIGDHTFDYTERTHPEHGTVGILKAKSSGGSHYASPNYSSVGSIPHIYHKPAGSGRGKYMQIDHPKAQELISKISS